MMNKCLYCYEPLSEGQDFHASCSLAFFGIESPPEIQYTLDEMAELAKEVVESRISVPGVQPKLSMSILKDSQARSGNRFTVVGALGGQYIFKPPSPYFPEMPENEHLTMKMAQAFGIRVVPNSLIRLASGEISYITKRIDRTTNGEKIHMLDMFQVTEAVDKYLGSMEKVGKAIGNFSVNPQLDQIFFLELALFSFITGNNDMHLKNFSMIHQEIGWVLAQAYDLLNVAIILPQDTEELALTLAGKKRKLQRGHFEDLGRMMGLTHKQISGVFERMRRTKSKAYDLTSRSFLSEPMKTAYLELMESRFDVLFS